MPHPTTPPRALGLVPITLAIIGVAVFFGITASDACNWNRCSNLKPGATLVLGLHFSAAIAIASLKLVIARLVLLVLGEVCLLWLTIDWAREEPGAHQLLLAFDLLVFGILLPAYLFLSTAVRTFIAGTNQRLLRAWNDV